MSILIVEDNDDWRELLALNLKVSGYDSVKAKTLEAAESALRSAKFDLVLLDLYLNGESAGAATVARVQAAAPDLPIVVVTGADLDFVDVKLPPGVEVLNKMKASKDRLIQTVELAIKRHEAKGLKDEVEQAMIDTGKAAAEVGKAVEAVKQSADEIKKTLNEAKP